MRKAPEIRNSKHISPLSIHPILPNILPVVAEAIRKDMVTWSDAILGYVCLPTTPSSYPDESYA